MTNKQKKKLFHILPLGKAWLGFYGIILLLVIFIGISEYFINFALKNDTSDYNIEQEIDSFKINNPYAATWMDSIRETKALKDTFSINRDGLKIHAWYLASPDSTSITGYSPHTAVLVHGYETCSFTMMQIGYMYNHDLHWNVIIPDLIAHGQSEGKWVSMGWKDRWDVIQWCRIAHGIWPGSDDVVHGISMGAAATMFASGEKTPDYVRAFVEDCGYTSVWDEFTGELKNQFGLPSFPILNVTSLVCKVQFGWGLKEASAIKQLAKCTKPMLFIHGGDDDYVPTAMVNKLYEAKTIGKKAIWIAPGTNHANSYNYNQKEYTKKVMTFMQDNL